MVNPNKRILDLFCVMLDTSTLTNEQIDDKARQVALHLQRYQHKFPELYRIYQELTNPKFINFQIDLDEAIPEDEKTQRKAKLNQWYR